MERELENKRKKEINVVPYYLVLPMIERLSKKKGLNLFNAMDVVSAAWIDSLPSQRTLLEDEKKEIITKEELIKICDAVGIDLPHSNNQLLSSISSYGINVESWSKRFFVSKYRFNLPINGIYEPHLKESYDLFLKLFGRRYRGQRKKLKEILRHYDLSIRPLNFTSAIAKSEAIKNFLPDIEQKFAKDPFGVQRREHLILDNIRGKLIYLATRKIEHGTYLAILRTVGYCTAGCANCYRGEQTRQLQRFKAINSDGSEDIVYFLNPSEQVKRLIKRWNSEKNPPEDILFSGGEPMDITINEWKTIFESLKKAKHLKFLRICTGDLFLGEPFRISDPEFMAILKNWYEETGKPIKFAVHLPHPAFITPEAVYTILKLHKLGIGVEIQTQTPLEEGILSFQKDIEDRIKKLQNRKLKDKELIEAWAPSLAKSYKLLRELCVKIAMIGDRPYKFIHDMQKSVSVIYNTILFSLLSEPHVGTTDAAIRPTSFALFIAKLPNLNLGFHSLEYIAEVKGAYKTILEHLANVDGAHKTILKMVKFKIPHAYGEFAEYEEPLIEGINDLNTLKRVADIKFWKRLRGRVMELVGG